MADVQPLRALHYDQAVAGPLQDLVAPPYDVIDPPAREEPLAGQVAPVRRRVVLYERPDRGLGIAHDGALVQPRAQRRGGGGVRVLALGEVDRDDVVR